MKKIKLFVIGLILLGSMGWAADKPISQLPVAETVESNDLFMISNYSAGSYFSQQLSFLNFKTKLDTFYQPIGQGGMVYPSAGISVSTGEGWGSPATYSSITGLWASGACSGYLKSDGSCDTPSGSGGYTNLTSFIDQTAWRLFYSDGSGDVKELALGTDGQYLRSNGPSSVPSWGTPAGGGDGIDLDDIYSGTINDGDLTAYVSASKKLKSAGAPVAYTQPASNLPLCRTGSGTVGACTNLTDTAIPTAYTDIVGMWESGSCTGYLKSDGSCDTPSGGGNGIDYTPPEDPAPLCSDITGAIIACTNLKDEDLAEIEGSADDIGVKIETVSTDPEAVIECEGKDRTYIVDVEADLIFQLPADPSGRRYCFGNNDYATKISIVPDGTDTIRHAGDVTDSEGDNGLVSTGDESEFICLLGLSSSKWRTISYLGTWTIDEVELPSEPEEPPPGGDGAIGPSTWAQDSGTVTTTYGYSPLTPSQAGNVSYCHARLISGNGLTFPVGIYDASLTRLAYGAITPNSNDEGWYSTQLNTSVTLQDATTYNIALAASASWTASLRTFIVSGGPLYTAAETYSGETPPTTLTYASDLSGNNVIFVVHCNNSATPPEEE